VCADSTKWGSVGLASFAPLSAADVVITDSGLSAEGRASLGDAVRSLRIVDVERADAAEAHAR
jgi:DeoR/GlpR family transcriptional regulator of sugar metabolism